LNDHELLFQTITELPYPALIISEDNGLWNVIYSNSIIQSFFAESTESTDSVSLPQSLLSILKRYPTEIGENRFSLYDIDIFNKIFNIHFSKNGENIFIFFVEIDSPTLFESISFHDLSNACSAIVIIIDEQGCLVDMNECFLNLVGMEKESILGKPFFEQFIPGDQSKLMLYMQQIHASDVHHHHFMTPLKGAGDELYNINWQVSKKILKQDHIYLIAVGSDITKLYKENKKLKQELVSIKVGFDNFPYAVAYMNHQGRFTAMNSRFKKMLGSMATIDTVSFDQIPILYEHIDFKEMSEYIALIKEMSYTIEDNTKQRYQVDIQLISKEAKDIKFYIVVIRQLH
jgi:PAS domain S-box-containing protein